MQNVAQIFMQVTIKFSGAPNKTKTNIHSKTKLLYVKLVCGKISGRDFSSD